MLLLLQRALLVCRLLPASVYAWLEAFSRVLGKLHLACGGMCTTAVSLPPIAHHLLLGMHGRACKCMTLNDLLSCALCRR